jgi:hypothetical protein
MKRFPLFVSLLCMVSLSLAAETRAREQGTIVRMRMTDCMGSQHAFMDALSGTGRGPAGELCPEYVLVTDRVVYVITGKSSNQLVPLAETTRFRFQNNEVLIRVDDANRESHFRVKAMTLRPDWDRDQQVEALEAMSAAHHRFEGPVMMSSEQ